MLNRNSFEVILISCIKEDKDCLARHGLSVYRHESPYAHKAFRKRVLLIDRQFTDRMIFYPILNQLFSPSPFSPVSSGSNDFFMRTEEWIYFPFHGII